MLEDNLKIDAVGAVSDVEIIEEAAEAVETAAEAPVAKKTSIASVGATNENEYQETGIIEDHDDAEVQHTSSTGSASSSAGSSASVHNVVSADGGAAVVAQTTGNAKTNDEAEIEEDTPAQESSSGVDLKSFKSVFSKNDEIDEILSDLGYDKVFNKIDKNNDGHLSDDELKNSGLNSTKLEDLKADDIKKLAEKLGFGDEVKKSSGEDSDELSADQIAALKKALKKNSKDSDGSDSSSPVSSSGGSGSVGGSGGSYGTSGSSGSSGSSGTGSTGSSDSVKEKTLEELETEKKEKQTEVDKANDDLQAVASGENDKVKAAKEDSDAKKKEYEDILAKDDAVSQELKDKQKANAEEITTTEADVEKYDKQVLEDTEKIKGIETELTSLNSQLEQYKASLAEYPTEKTDENKDNWENIQAMRAQLEAQITETESQITAKEKEKSDAEAAKKTDEDTLKATKDKLEELKTTRDEIEKEIEKTCSEKTKDALKAYKEARENVDTVREAERTTAQTALDKVNGELDEINKQIDELKQKEIKCEYALTGDGQAVADFILDLVTNPDGSHKSVDAGTMQEAMAAAGCQFDAGAWCGDFVAYALKKAYGDNVPGDYLNTCSNTAYVPTIRSWGEEKGILTDDSSKVQPGDIIVYGNQHVGLVASVNSDGTVNTVEGNTSNDQTGEYGSPTGEGWCSFHSGMTGSYVLLSALK